MGYSTGMLDKRIGIWAVDRENTGGKAGRGSGGVNYKQVGCVWGSVKWNKGQRAMMEGALESYDVVMIRFRYTDLVDKDCRLACEGNIYQILQLQSDRRENIVQIIAQQTNEQLNNE